MSNSILAPSDLKDLADSSRLMGELISTQRIPKLKTELEKLKRDPNATDSAKEEKKEEIFDVIGEMNDCFLAARKIHNMGIVSAIYTDLGDAKAAINCSILKANLAVHKLNKIRSALKFVAAFLSLVGEITSVAFAEPGSKVASIKGIIEAIDKLSSTEFSAGLSDDEKKKLEAAFEPCLKG